MSDPIFARLTEIAAEIERHETASWLLRREQDELRGELRRASNPVPPTLEASHA